MDSTAVGLVSIDMPLVRCLEELSYHISLLYVWEVHRQDAFTVRPTVPIDNVCLEFVALDYPTDRLPLIEKSEFWAQRSFSEARVRLNEKVLAGCHNFEIQDVRTKVSSVGLHPCS